MTKSAKPLYELRPRGKHYQGIWQGEHCLAAICVKKQRGARDAQFLLRAANRFSAMEDAIINAIEAMDCGPNIDSTGLAYKRLKEALPKAKG